ncbi:MAG: hypothetical protein COU07_03585 [Candidatus Harrisonbacteria bacterium CG10_big_fil_rev_8_21_14_0_10_40_38]|uniref:Uncharacterized protein n=1 Tax=Candidatus Harrisonbacteria bacterium CG10_big_fil_rev_8_21_14_0_10_40_38 TaxID=1974583 RepID=A0A2H0UR96_9BACT|nr:MAG: hypothetical protein COU07_03585 [Candidatus Harrisonbacteria bacterium CG10_big_fil_rev_8_21_14_0_10_40_38]
MDTVRPPSPLSERDHKRSLIIIILALALVAGFIIWQSFFRTEPYIRDGNLSEEEYIKKLKEPIPTPARTIDPSIIDILTP